MRAECPHCHEVIVTNDLQVVTRHLAGCNKKAKTATVVAPKIPNRIVEPLTLPVTLMLRKKVLTQNFMKSKHWRHYAKHTKEWYQHLEPHCYDLRGLGLSWSVWELTRVVRSPCREFDYGNLVGGCKPIPDGLLRHRVICEDSPKHFKCHYFQRTPEEAQAPDGIETILRLIEYRF